MRKARLSRLPVRPSSPDVLRCAPARPDPAAPIWSLASTKRRATTRPCSRSPATCRARCRGIDYFQTTDPDLLFRDVSLYTETIISPAQAPAVIHQAIAAAYAGRGVAHLDPAAGRHRGENGGVASVATLTPRPGIRRERRRILPYREPDRHGRQRRHHVRRRCHGAADELRALSDRLKAPLIHSVKGKDIMPYDDPRWMGGIGMIGTKADYNADHALRSAADARHRLSLFGIPAQQRRGHPGRRAGRGARPPRADRARRAWLGAADAETRCWVK